MSGLVAAGRPLEATSELERAVGGGYHTAWAFKTLAGIYAREGRTEDLLRAATSLVEVYPRSSRMNDQLCALLRSTHTPGEASPAVGQVLEQLRHRDLEVVLSWDTKTDLDLDVTEPDGETCSYSKQRTPEGGSLSHDDTDGLGPETYSRRLAARGSYSVDVVFFGGGPATTATVRVVDRSKGPRPVIRTWTVRLTQKGERRRLGTLTVR